MVLLVYTSFTVSLLFVTFCLTLSHLTRILFKLFHIIFLLLNLCYIIYHWISRNNLLQPSSLFCNLLRRYLRLMRTFIKSLYERDVLASSLIVTFAISFDIAAFDPYFTEIVSYNILRRYCILQYFLFRPSFVILFHTTAFNT